MARFHNLEHQIVVEPIVQDAGFTVERVRRFDQTALLAERERWSQWAFRITLGGTRYVTHAAQTYMLAPNTIFWHGPLREPVKLRGLPGTSNDQLVLRFGAQYWNRRLAEQPRFADRHAQLLARHAHEPVLALNIAPPQVLLVVRDLLALNETLRPARYAIEQQCELLLHLLSDLSFDQQEHDPLPERRQRVEAAQAILARDPGQPPSLGQLATCLNVSPRQLQRDFLACTGLTPRRYLNIMRLSEANALLSDTSVPIATIAAQLGYVSQTHFSAAFKQVYHCSPRQFRAAMRGQAEPTDHAREQEFIGTKGGPNDESSQY